MRKQRIYRLNPPEDALDETPLLPEERLRDPSGGAAPSGEDGELDAALQRLVHGERSAGDREETDRSS